MRYTVHFSGRVQGVGFRYTARELSQSHEVAGYVQNLPDGRVLLVAEGEAEHLDALVQDILKVMDRYVREHAIDKSPHNGEFGTPGIDGLTIRR